MSMRGHVASVKSAYDKAASHSDSTVYPARVPSTVTVARKMVIS